MQLHRSTATLSTLSQLWDLPELSFCLSGPGLGSGFPVDLPLLLSVAADGNDARNAVILLCKVRGGAFG